MRQQKTSRGYRNNKVTREFIESEFEEVSKLEFIFHKQITVAEITNPVDVGKLGMRVYNVIHKKGYISAAWIRYIYWHDYNYTLESTRLIDIWIAQQDFRFYRKRNRRKSYALALKTH